MKIIFVRNVQIPSMDGRVRTIPVFHRIHRHPVK